MDLNFLNDIKDIITSSIDFLPKDLQPFLITAITVIIAAFIYKFFK